MIRLKNINVIFKESENPVKAVNNLSLNINRGEIFGIVGSSGAGKSTLLRTINLLERPVEGKVYIDGKDVTNYKRENLRVLRQRIGMIFQHFNLITRKTVFDNVAFPMIAAKIPRDEITQRVNELLGLVGLSHKSSAYPGQLSGGEKQRVGIARALANKTEILLCDEPTSALDLETTKSILDLLKEINTSLGITIVIISHEMDVVKSICHKVAVMKNGSLVEVGDTYEIFANPKDSFTKQLVEHAFHLEFPRQIFEDFRGILLKIVYKGDTAAQPLLSQSCKKFNISFNIIHGKIEYIGNYPIGILVINLEGEEKQIKLAIDYINARTAFTEVLYAN